MKVPNVAYVGHKRTVSRDEAIEALVDAACLGGNYSLRLAIKYGITGYNQLGKEELLADYRTHIDDSVECIVWDQVVESPFCGPVTIKASQSETVGISGE